MNGSGQRHSPEPWALPSRVRGDLELAELFPHTAGTVFLFQSLAIVVFEDCSIDVVCVAHLTEVLR